MLHGGNQVYNSEWKWAVPYVWDGSAWKRVIPYVYNNNTWQILSGAGQIVYNFLESTGLTYNSTANIMVREDTVYDRWLDKDNKVIKCTDNKLTRKPTLYMKLIH